MEPTLELPFVLEVAVAVAPRPHPLPYNRVPLHEGGEIGPTASSMLRTGVTVNVIYSEYKRTSA